MKTRKTLTAGVFLVAGGFVCTVMTFAMQQQTHRKMDQPMIQIDKLPTACANIRLREPVLVYDKSGGTLIGPVHEQLSVYSDGLATYSRIDAAQPDGFVTVKTLSEETVQALAETLAAAGAEETCDEAMVVLDVPMVTVTVFGTASTDAAAHTFSYFDSASGAAALVEGILQDFIEAEIEGTR